MNILDAIVHAQDGRAVQQLGSQFGLGDEQTASALSALVPALAAGFQQNMQSEDGLGGLVSALSGGRHQEYIENPAKLGDPSAVADGNGILAHVLGSKQVSRDVATRAAAQTGLSADLLKRMLPLVATMMMGAMAGQTRGAPSTGERAGGLADMLSPLLDRNRDGSIVDDVAGMLGRVMGR